jgi:hypothetical protein
VTLNYNETNEQATAEPILIASGPHVASGPNASIESMYRSPPPTNFQDTSAAFVPDEATYANNEAVAKELAGLSVRKSPFASEVINAVLSSAARRKKSTSK